MGLSSFLHTVHKVTGCRAPNPCLPQQQDIIPHVKNLSLALLKMGKSLPETCWGDHWRSIKPLLLHLVGFYFTLPTLMMHGQTQIKFVCLCKYCATIISTCNCTARSKVVYSFNCHKLFVDNSAITGHVQMNCMQQSSPWEAHNTLHIKERGDNAYCAVGLRCVVQQAFRLSRLGETDSILRHPTPGLTYVFPFFGIIFQDNCLFVCACVHVCVFLSLTICECFRPFLSILYVFLFKRRVNPGYNDIGLYDTSPIESDVLWHLLRRHS